MFEFLTLLDRAQLWAARGEVLEALATIKAARQILAGTGSVLLTRADELEALLRLSLGDRRAPAELARRLPPARRSLLHARIALASGDHRAAVEHLHSPPSGDLTPRRALVRQLVLAAAAIERGDPMAASIIGGAVHIAREEGYLNTIISTAPQVTSYLIGQAVPAQRDPFIEQLIGAGLEVRAAQPDGSRSGTLLAEPLTPAELRVLKLLPTSTYLQIAEVLYVSRNTVKTHLRSIYQKLGVESRPQAIERAVELRLLLRRSATRPAPTTPAGSPLVGDGHELPRLPSGANFMSRLPPQPGNRSHSLGNGDGQRTNSKSHPAAPRHRVG